MMKRFQGVDNDRSVVQYFEGRGASFIPRSGKRCGCIVRRNDLDSDNFESITVYKVVVNHEEQYSIWPAHLELPLGWRSVGKEGLKADCLAYIKDVWTDMRPLSVRRKLEESKSADRP